MCLCALIACAWTHMYITWTQKYTDIYINAQTNTNSRKINAHTQTHICSLTDTDTDTHTHTAALSLPHTHTRTHSHVHTHTHTHPYTQTQTLTHTHRSLAFARARALSIILPPSCRTCAAVGATKAPPEISADDDRLPANNTATATHVPTLVIFNTRACPRQQTLC